MDLQKILSRILHPLVSPKILSMHRNNISFTILSDLFISNLLSSSCALVFRLGQNLSNIPRSILSKQKFPLILPLSEHKALRSYLFSSDLTSLLSTELHKSSRILRTTTTDLRTKLSLFFSSQQSQFQVPTTEPFVGTGADPGFNASTMHQQNPNYRPFRQHLRSR
jgi:hypothetical protein